MIELIDLCKKFVVNKKEINALKKINLTFEKGTFYAVMGPSGSGKSTLLQLMGLLDNKYSGTIKVDNQDISSLSEGTLAKLRSKKIGFVFQSFFLDDSMKAYENVMLPLYLNKYIEKSNRKKYAISILNKLGLENRIEHYPKQLSGGEQQRVSIARALINDPDIIIADEPTGNLDEVNEINILKLLKELSLNGKCVIVASHNNLIKQYADKIIYLNKGMIGDGLHESH